MTPRQGEVLAQLLEFAHGRTPYAMATLAGYAGVGKTFVVAELVRQLRPVMDVLISAPTNKAVAVLREKIDSDTHSTSDADSMTIHSALGMKVKEREDGSQILRKESASKLSGFDFAVVDEASMLQNDLFAECIAHARGCNVLFVGDPAQLAPVQEMRGISRVFDQSIIPMHLSMTEVVRQAAGNPIIQFATYLRECVVNNRGPDLVVLAQIIAANPGDDRLCLLSGGDGMLQDCASAAHQNGLDTRICTFRRNTMDRHNAAIHARLFPQQAGFSVGEPLMAQEGATATWHEFYSASAKPVEIRNSELMTVASCHETRHPDFPDVPAWRLGVLRESGATAYAFVPQSQSAFTAMVQGLFGQAKAAKAEEKYHLSTSLSRKAWNLKKAFANIQHGYAMTTHKAQGSTFDTVLFPWSDTFGMRDPVEVSRLLYVAATRAAKNFAVVV